MDTDVLVDGQIAEGEALLEQLIKDNFDVSVAFWVRITPDAIWHLYLGSPQFDPVKSAESYRKVYSSLESIAPITISNIDINIISDKSPIAVAAIKIRDQFPSSSPTKYFGKRLATLPIQEAYIYQKIEVPIRQSFTVSYVRHENPDEWRATVRINEFYRGISAMGAISYSQPFGLSPEAEGPKVALVYVMVEVGSGIDEATIFNHPVMRLKLANQAITLADEEFKRRHPNARIVHEPILLF
jgi:hypothetical protein